MLQKQLGTFFSNFQHNFYMYFLLAKTFLLTYYFSCPKTGLLLPIMKYAKSSATEWPWPSTYGTKCQAYHCMMLHNSTDFEWNHISPYNEVKFWQRHKLLLCNPHNNFDITALIYGHVTITLELRTKIMWVPFPMMLWCSTTL